MFDIAPETAPGFREYEKRVSAIYQSGPALSSRLGVATILSRNMPTAVQHQQKRVSARKVRESITKSLLDSLS
jgi:hypothetical protein